MQCLEHECDDLEFDVVDLETEHRQIMTVVEAKLTVLTGTR